MAYYEVDGKKFFLAEDPGDRSRNTVTPRGNNYPSLSSLTKKAFNDSFQTYNRNLSRANPPSYRTWAMQYSYNHQHHDTLTTEKCKCEFCFGLTCDCHSCNPRRYCKCSFCQPLPQYKMNIKKDFASSEQIQRVN